MRKLKEQSAKILFISLFALIIQGACQAQAALPIQFSASASESGLSINYNIPFVGIGNVALDEPGKSQTINLAFLTIQLATIELTLNEVTAEPPAVNVHYAVTSPFFQVPEKDISIPFGELGAALNVFGIFPPVKQGNHSIEAALLLKKNKVQYDVEANIVSVIADSWVGNAVPGNNEINEKIITQNGTELANVQLAFDWTVPLFTNVTYDVTIAMPVPEGMDNSTMILPPVELKGGPIPIPNGSYHVWFNVNK
ncbi:MAG: hypothetical protein WCQ99_17205 [Pseudomonadota bacterium]